MRFLLLSLEWLSILQVSWHSHHAESFSLVLFGFVEEHDTNYDQDSPNGWKAGNPITENNNTEPDWKCVFHSAGDTKMTEKQMEKL